MTMAHSSSRALLSDMRETDEHARVAAFYGALFATGHDRTTTRALNASGLGELVRVPQRPDATAYCPRALSDDIPTHSNRNDVRFLLTVAAALNLCGEIS